MQNGPNPQKEEITRTLQHQFLAAALAAGLFAPSQLYAAEIMMKSGGLKKSIVNTGFVAPSKSDEFKTPDAPDPHGQMVDSGYTVYRLQ